ncbi:MAG: hypothetical protein H7196_05130 [candidate division SR1 bacterium]|nr:hypothetical protein [candidate division SR1 bacterium]
MTNILKKESTKLFIFLALLLSFVSMGVYNVYDYSVTIDEPAHIGAAESYRWHEGVNPEHPPLMKVLNAILIRLKFPNYKTIAAGQYAKGAEFLWLSEYNPNIVIQLSRFVYLVAHSLIFLWFWYYTFFRKIINKKFSLIFLTLFVFSPTVITLNPLLLFDIAGAIGALMAVFSSILLLFNLRSITKKYLIFDTLITAFSISFALLSKFTNLYLVPVFIVILVSSLICYFKKKQINQIWKKLLPVLGSIITITLINIWIVYNYAYKNLPYIFTTHTGLERKVLIPFWRMYDGAMLIYNYVRDTPKPNFIDDKYVFITYQQFINRVFLFKENPILPIIIALCVIFIIWSLLKYSKYIKKYLTLQNLLISLCTSSYPILYFFIAKDKFFAIGFRHFLAIDVFIFAGLAAIIYYASNLKPKFNSIIIVLLILYAIFGSLSLQSGVGYTNFLWQKPNWELANDSTIFLAEYQKKPLEYLYSLGLLKPNNNGDITFIYRGHFISPQMQIYQITGNKDERYGSYNIEINPITELITNSKAKYLVLDIFWFHEILNNISTKNGIIAEQNWKYIESYNPIYSYNKAVFIYKLN